MKRTILMLLFALASVIAACSHQGGSSLPYSSPAPQDSGVPRKGMSGGTPYASLVLSSNPTRFYELQDASGPTAIDSSTAAINGTYSSGNVTYGLTGPLLSEPSKAIGLPGNTISTPVDMGVTAPSINAASGTPYTIEIWVKPTLVSSSTTFNLYYTLWGQDGTHRLMMNSTTGQLLAQYNVNFFSVGKLATGVWSYVVLTYNPSTTTASLYINGALDSTDTVSTAAAALTGTTSWVGEYASSSAYYKWDGDLADFAFYPSALSSSTISSHYNTALSTPTPSPSPTPTATPSGAYAYHGCPVYTANDWFTTNLVTGGSAYVSNTVAATSANITSNLNTTFPTLNFSANVVAGQENANIYDGTNLTAQPVIQGLSYGFGLDPYGDDTNKSIWVTNPWHEEGGSSFCTNGSGECHAVVLNTQTCVVIETYKSGVPEWNPSTGVYTASGGGVENLNHPYHIQINTVTSADIPMMGTTDWGEDLDTYNQASCRTTNSCVIPHIVQFFLPQRSEATDGCTAGTNGCVVTTPGKVDPADYGQTCSSHCSYPIPEGARLRLKSSYSCPAASSYPQANILCNQAKQYGWILTDFTGISNGGGIRLGERSDLSNPWTSSDYNQFLGTVKITDFDVMSF